MVEIWRRLFGDNRGAPYIDLKEGERKCTAIVEGT
jgi:hypothetical protein